MTPEHIRAQQYRKRKAEKLARLPILETALRDILNRIEGRDGPVARDVTLIAKKALYSQRGEDQ